MPYRTAPMAFQSISPEVYRLVFSLHIVFSFAIFLPDDAQRLDSSRETDIWQALDDGGCQCFWRIAHVDITVIVRL